ncbi:MAG: hypothetical protein JWM16_4032 [Verrucomicrobiales bacterium]|nr:hypothetical protein [Verrucomicrobiales bacterium]
MKTTMPNGISQSNNMFTSYPLIFFGHLNAHPRTTRRGEQPRARSSGYVIALRLLPTASGKLLPFGMHELLREIPQSFFC